MRAFKALSRAIGPAKLQDDAEQGHSNLILLLVPHPAVCWAAELQPGPQRLHLPHGYIAQSASDLMLFTNPLVQDTLPADWESRCLLLIRSAAELDLSQHGLPLMHVHVYAESFVIPHLQVVASI